VCGIVSNQDSQATLPGATVSVDDSSNITTKNGAFNLNNVALDATITISFIGYQSSQFTANELFSAEKTAGKSS
jgi:NAD(P)H-hydrate repair Nnr-like enzyme with NAD(P)H-hydrate epimerase domain